MSNEQEEIIESKVWIKNIIVPIEVYINKNLSETDKFLFGIINVLDGPKGCYATNEYLSVLLGVKPNTVSISISNLVKEELIISTITNNNQRTIKVNKNYYIKHAESVKNYEETILEIQRKRSFDNYQRGVSQPSKGGLTNVKHNNKEEEYNIKTMSKDIDTRLTPGCGKSLRERIKEGTNKKGVRRRHSEDTDNNFESARAIIEKWNETNLLPRHQTGTKVYERVVNAIESLLNGTFFNTIPTFEKYKDKKFKRSEIIETIRRHQLAATSPDYYPLDKKYLLGVRLNDFLYCEYSKNKSLFISYFEREPVLVAEKQNSEILSKDKNPDITKIIKNWYSEFVLKGNNGSYSPSEMKDFVTASERIKNFSVEKGKLINNVDYWIGMYDCKDMPELITKLTLEMFEDYLSKSDKRFHTGFLSSEKTYTTYLLDYLKSTSFI